MKKNVVAPIDDLIQWERTLPLKHITLRLQFQQQFERGSAFPGRSQIIVNMNSHCLHIPNHPAPLGYSPEDAVKNSPNSVYNNNIEMVT